MRKNNLEKHIPMIRQQLWNICLSIKKSNPKLHKALVKDLIKLETERKIKKKIIADFFYRKIKFRGRNFL